MDVAVVSRFLALLAVVAALIAVLGAVRRLAGARAPRALRLEELLTPRGALALAAMIAVVATAGSLTYSEAYGFVPCELCWYQRIAMYPLVVVLGVAAWRSDLAVRRYAAPLAAIGAALSIYHVLIQRGLVGAGACDASAPCSVVWVRELGVVTIPGMALAGFLGILALLDAAASARTTDGDGT